LTFVCLCVGIIELHTDMYTYSYTYIRIMYMHGMHTCIVLVLVSTLRPAADIFVIIAQN